MKTVTLCSSMKFAAQMKEIAFVLETCCNMNVLQCVYDPPREITNAEKQSLVAAHRLKITLSDAVYVVDIDGYIGQSVREEIAFAEGLGKEIIYHSSFMPSAAETTTT